MRFKNSLRSKSSTSWQWKIRKEVGFIIKSLHSSSGRKNKIISKLTFFWETERNEIKCCTWFMVAWIFSQSYCLAGRFSFVLSLLSQSKYLLSSFMSAVLSVWKVKENLQIDIINSTHNLSWKMFMRSKKLV